MLTVMRITNIKIIIILIVGVVVFTATAVFSAEDYNSSRSNTQTSIPDDQEKATSAVNSGLELARDEIVVPDTGDIPKEMSTSVYKTVELTQKVFAVDEDGIQVVNKAELIEAIASETNITKTNAERVIDALMKVSSVFTIDENGLQEANKVELIESVASGANLTKADARRALDAFVGATAKSLRGGNRVALVGFGSFSISKATPQTGATIQIPAKKVVRFKAGADLSTTVAGIKLQNEEFQDASKNIIQNIRSAAPEERKDLREELKVSRRTFQTEIVSMNLKIRENAKELREKFRENVGTTGADWDYKRTAHIAIAHGKGLRMLNRFRSAIARFDHILGRLESRIEKLEARGYPTDSFFDVFTSIEEAKNMSVENEAKLEELKAKYESLLLGEDVKGVAEEARAIATELKSEIQTLHAKLIKIADDIRQAAGDYNSSISNSSTL